jgi:cytochrome c biogenesis protein CcmG/thiol:disulfide interchange protein DsbE
MSKVSDLLASKLGGKIFTGVVLALAMTVVVIFAMPSYRQGEPGVAGKRASDFAFELNGRTAHLSDLRGQVVVLNFWATWCPPCVAEIGTLNALQRDISGHGGTVLGISVDEDADAYEKFLVEHKVPFPNFRDPTKKIPESYGTLMYPETYIIDTDGRIARKIVGEQEWDNPQLAKYVESLLPAKGK